MEYKCFNCGKTIDVSLLKKKIRCPYCGSKLLFKPREVIKKVKAR